MEYKTQCIIECMHVLNMAFINTLFVPFVVWVNLIQIIITIFLSFEIKLLDSKPKCIHWLLFYFIFIRSQALAHFLVYDNTIGSDEWLQMPQFGPKDFCQLGAIDYIFNYNHKVCVTYGNFMWTYNQIIAGQTDQPLNQEKTFGIN